MISFDKFTQKAQEAIVDAKMLANEANHQLLLPAHLLVALASATHGIVRSVLSKLGIDPDETASAARGLLDAIPTVRGATAGKQMDRALQHVFTAAEKEADRFKDEYVSTEHLLLGISSRHGDPAQQLLREAERRTRQFSGRSPRFAERSVSPTPTRKTSTRR